MESKTQRLIQRIEITRLFGSLSYNIMVPKTSDPESGQLLLLYGDNGTGKSTILRLLYHLLSPRIFEGHKTNIAEVPFQGFRVWATDGTRVVVERTGDSAPGPYELTISDPDGTPITKWEWKENKPGEDDEPAYRQACEALAGLKIGLHFLPDNRRVDDETTQGRRHRIIRDSSGRRVRLNDSDEDDPSSPEALLEQTIGNTIQTFGQQALSQSNIGYSSVYTIYRDIVRQLVKFGGNAQTDASESLQDLNERLIGLGTRNETFARFGLVPELDAGAISDLLDEAADNQSALLSSVLTPYLDGHQARLNALQDLQKVMDTFVTLLGEFYSQKSVSIHVGRGLTIKSSAGLDLDPSVLSSGEKQLLLLFCNAIQARRDNTVFIVDEPELSLNVKWQRLLVGAMMECLKGVKAQLILATHSIEILSQYREYVVPLRDIDD